MPHKQGVDKYKGSKKDYDAATKREKGAPGAADIMSALGLKGRKGKKGK